MSSSGIVLSNSRVLTMDGDLPLAEAVVTSGDRIAYVGDKNKLSEELTYGKELIDLEGRTLVPGFIDSHVHLVEMARSRMGLDLGGCHSIKDVLDIVKQETDSRARGEWVIGYNWDESRWKENRAITIKELDRISPNHPVILKRICQHLVVVNTRALEIACIPKGTEGLCLDPKTGNPNGKVQLDARRIIESHLKFPPKRLNAAIEAAQKEMLSLGITSIHDMGSDLRLLQKAYTEGRLAIRTYLYVGEHELSEIDSGGVQRNGDDYYFRTGGVKFFVDGSIGAHSAALSEPYADGEGGCGRVRWDTDALKSLVSNVHERGWQVSLHAIGDKAIKIALDILEHAQRSYPREDPRHRIEHCELPPEGTPEQIKELGIIISAQPNFFSMWGQPGGMYEKHLGKRRWEGIDPWGRLHRKSIPLAFGSDGMPVGPLYGIWSAVNHHIEGNSLDPVDAIRSYTYGGAFASFEEDTKGTITQNKLADMVVLSRDPTTIPRGEIKD
ncbi:MAG: amidohydrolase, partial [Candidatus Brocadiales bacterium]